MHKSHCVSMFILLLLAVSTVNANPQRLNPAIADSLVKLTDDLAQKADYYSLAWMHEKALEMLVDADDSDVGILWRRAKYRIDIGENLAGDAALNLYESAYGEASRAVEIDPENALAQQTLAVACGRVALFKGVFKSIGMVKMLRAAALKSVASGDSVPIAYYVLGRTHKKLLEKPGFVRKALGLGWAKTDSVIYYFEKAIEISHGNMIQCYFEYGDFLASADEETKAVDLLRRALLLPLRDEQDEKAQLKAKELLTSMKTEE